MARAVFRHLHGSKANQVEQFELDDITELTFGRDPAASISFADKDDLVSRRHATISVERGDVLSFVLRDLGSSNGTFVNGARVAAPIEVFPGDTIELAAGGPKLVFDVEPRPPHLAARTRTFDAGAAQPTREQMEDTMPLTNYVISNLQSFQATTGDPRQIAALYAYQQLDCLVDVAHNVSYDFFMRPKLYIDLGDAPQNVATRPAAQVGETRPLREILAELHARFGYDELFPSNPQRDEIFLPIFGGGGCYSTAEEGDFPRLRDAVISAAAAFAERVFDTGVEMLQERMRTTVRLLRQYLTGLQGDSIKWSRENALSGLTENVTYAILRSPGVSGVFGIRTPPGQSWPYIEDNNGDKLIEAISRQLQWADQPDAYIVTWEHILNLQRAALRGAEAIATIIDFREPGSNDELSQVITRCYSWGAALLSVTSAAMQPPQSTVAAQPPQSTVAAQPPQSTVAAQKTHLTTMVRKPYVMRR